VWVAGCRIPARGWRFSGVGRMAFGWVKWMTVCGGCGDGGHAFGGSRWSPLADDAWRTAVTPDAGHWLPVRGRERLRNELESEGGIGESGLRYPTSTPLFVPFSFFLGLN